MTTMHTGAVLRQIDRLFGVGTVAGLSDAQLLARFRTQRDEAAFVALVARHGPMVLAVCRGVLRDEHAAEDAFQATFLILVRKAARSGLGSRSAAGSIGSPTGLRCRPGQMRSAARAGEGQGKRPPEGDAGRTRTTSFGRCFMPRSAGCPIGSGFPWCSATWRG